MSTHVAISSLSKGHFDAVKVPTPSPGEGEVLIKVAYSGLSPIDVYINDLALIHATFPLTLGYSASGTIAQVGPGVQDLKVGDRVAAYTYRASESKGMQEYAIVTKSVVAMIPDSLPLDAAATLPNNFITSFNSLFNPEYLALPIPSSFPPSTPPVLANTPVLVYGGATSCGHFAIQILRIAGYRNIMAIASPKNHEQLRSLGAAHIFDYNSPRMVEDIKNVVEASSSNKKIEIVLDCISSQSTISDIAKLPSGVVAILLPFKMGNSFESEELYMEIPDDMNPLPKGVRIAGVRNLKFEENAYMKDNIMPKILPAILQIGAIQPHRVRLINELFGSLKERVVVGMDLLRNDQVSREKVIVKVQ